MSGHTINQPDDGRTGPTGEPKTLRELDELLALENRGAEVVVAQTDLCPAIVVRARTKQLALFADLEAWGLGGPARMAIPTANGAEIVAAGPAAGAAFDGARQTDPWILCWFEGAPGWDQLWYGQPCHWRGHHPEKAFPHVDVPWLVVLQRRAEKIEVGAEGLALSFAGEAGTIVMMPLYGADLQDVVQTRAWRENLPDGVRERCERWSRILRRVPVGCREFFKLDEARDMVSIRQVFDYLEIEDDWGTRGHYVAPLPLFATLAALHGFPVRQEGNEDEVATLYGPWRCRVGARSAGYEIHGALMYIIEDEVRSNAPCSPAAEHALARLRQALGDDPRLAVKTSGGYTRGLALALASYAHALRYVGEEQYAAVREVMEELVTRILDPSNYMPLIRYGTEFGTTRDDLSEGAVVRDRLTSYPTQEPVGEGICQRIRDAYKVVQANLFGVWAAFEMSGDWERAREAWPLIRRWFHLPYQTAWFSPLPARWEGLDIARALFDGTIGFARLAARVGAVEDYRAACYLFAKVCAGWFAMEQMGRYMRDHKPWLFNTDVDSLVWHPCRLNGYVLIANDHLRPNEQPEVDGRGWASAYGRMTPTSARFWRDHLADRAEALLGGMLPGCRPDWAAAGAPAVMRAYVLGESAETLERRREADEAAERAAARDPLRLRTWRLFQSTPVLKEIATIEASAEPTSVKVVSGVEAMPGWQEGASGTASRMEQAALPVRVETSDEMGGFPLLFWPGVRPPRKPFAVLDERLDVLPFGSIKWRKLPACEKSGVGQVGNLSQSQADSLIHLQEPLHAVHHPNWCLTLFTWHRERITNITMKSVGQVGNLSPATCALEWSTPTPANSVLQSWKHDLGEMPPLVQTVVCEDLVRDHRLAVNPPSADGPQSAIRNRQSAIHLFRVLSFDRAGHLYRSDVLRLPTGRANWARGRPAFVSKRFPFKEFKHAADREEWLRAFRSEGKQWNVLKPPHELTDGRGLRPHVEPWIRHAETDPTYVHWIAIDLGQPRPVDEVVIAHDPGWVAAGYRIEAGPGDAPWSADLAGAERARWTELLAEAKDNRAAVARHGFERRDVRWVRIVYTHPAPVGMEINRVVLWEIEVRGPAEEIADCGSRIAD